MSTRMLPRVAGFLILVGCLLFSAHLLAQGTEKYRPGGRIKKPTKKVKPRRELDLPFNTIAGNLLDKQTLSQSQAIASEKFPTSTMPINDYLEGRLQYMLEGVRHFRKQEAIPAHKREAMSEQMEEMIKRTVVWNGGIDFYDMEADIKHWESDPEVNKDPFVMDCIGRFYANTSNHAVGRKWLLAAREAYIESDYPARTVVANHATNHQIGKIYLKQPGISRNPHTTSYLDSVVYWLKYDFRASPEELRFVWADIELCLRYAFQQDKLDRVKRLLEFDKEKDLLPDCLRAMAHGQYHISAGWAVRGNGFAGTVPPKAWPIFHRHLAQATTHFEKALQLCPHFPEPAQRMIYVALAAEGGEPPQFWLDKALKIAPDDIEAYDEMLFVLTPKWGGGLEEMVNLGIECAEAKDFESAVPMFFPWRSKRPPMRPFNLMQWREIMEGKQQRNI